MSFPPQQDSQSWSEHGVNLQPFDNKFGTSLPAPQVIIGVCHQRCCVNKNICSSRSAACASLFALSPNNAPTLPTAVCPTNEHRKLLYVQGCVLAPLNRPGPFHARTRSPHTPALVGLGPSLVNCHSEDELAYFQFSRQVWGLRSSAGYKSQDVHGVCARGAPLQNNHTSSRLRENQSDYKTPLLACRGLTSVRRRQGAALESLGVEEWNG